MRRHQLFWQIYASYLLITLVAVGSVAVYALRAERIFYLRNLELELGGRAFQMGQLIQTPDGLMPADAVDRQCAETGARLGTRFTVVLADGVVVGDTEGDPSQMDNHADRPEIVQAVQSGRGVSTRYSETLRENRMYVGHALYREGRLIGVVRASVSLAAIQNNLGAVSVRIVGMAMVIAAIAAGLGWMMVRRVSGPLREMKRGAERFAEGQLGFRLRVPASSEMAGLAASLNEMAGQLSARIESIERQRHEQEAVLTSMVEGVVAIDNDERILHMNRAADALLGVRQEEAVGRILQEVVRNADLQRFASAALASDAPVEGEMVQGGEEDRFLQAHGTALRAGDGRRIGALVVLHDVTRLRRLENVRRDFVANVTHELKTPVTSIKGFVETLLDGAADDRAERMRFLGIIDRQVGRLNAILSDLLSLSRIEHEVGRNHVTLERQKLAGVIKQAVEICEDRAKQSNVSLEVACDRELVADISAPLVEQAVVNLVDNAVKYSESGKTVAITVAEENGGVAIRVRDEGCGIEKKHLSRVFERFYRVDKGRSRQMGGTGLGLSIVRHIALAHRGSVSVESTPGVGSVFTIQFPSVSA